MQRDNIGETLEVIGTKFPEKDIDIIGSKKKNEQMSLRKFLHNKENRGQAKHTK